MKIVLDSNVLIAAFASRGLCNELFEICLLEHEICISEIIIKETRKALVNKIKLPTLTINNIIELLETHSSKVVPVQINKDVCRDPGDLDIIGTAISAGAPVILTGDKDLLVLKKYENIKILSPTEFWKFLISK